MDFRFKKDDIYSLAVALRLPVVFKGTNGLIVDTVEALCTCLRRLPYPSRYADLVPRFGRPVPQLCMIFNKVIDFIVDTHGHLLRSLDQPFLSREICNDVQMQFTKRRCSRQLLGVY